jgi:TolB protein
MEQIMSNKMKQQFTNIAKSIFSKHILVGIMAVCICLISFGCKSASPYGIFEQRTDIGDVNYPGAMEYCLKTREYKITGGGADIWFGVDAFCYVWKQISGDVELMTDISWVVQEGHEYRKAGWMIRQDLQPDSSYVDAIAHGGGLISLQYRLTKGADTEEIQSDIPAPATLKLIRSGDVFSLYVSEDGKKFESAGEVSLSLSDPVYAGLVVCPHNNAITETAIFKNVKMKQKKSCSGDQ